jgi:hypothetical protein
MSIKIILFLFVFASSFCNGQITKKIETDQTVVKSKTAKNSTEADSGIIYFSYDNGNTWRNASSGIPQKVSIGLGGVAVAGKVLAVATKEYGVYSYNFNDSTWFNIPTEKQIIDGNLGALIFYKNTIYVGTQHKGIFYSQDYGKTWTFQNAELNNLTIRRFIEYENMLYVCTNDGFYSLNKDSNGWESEYGYNSLQVNGATVFKGSFYIATNKGVYKKVSGSNWRNVLPDHSIHNISSANEELFAMTYNELLLSSRDGIIWQSAQDGLPENLYTFNVLYQNHVLFAGQWDGVYSKSDLSSKWKKSSIGLPTNFAVTNLISFDGILVITTSVRKFKTDKIR